MSFLFERWCSLSGEHPIPASVQTLVRFITENAVIPAETMHAELTRLDELHENLGYHSVSRSTPVVQAFASVYPVEPPRSWGFDERQLFAILPWGVKQVLRRREDQRDAALSRCQNDASMWRQHQEKLKEKSDAKTKTQAA